MNTITMADWSEKIHESLPNISNFRKRFGAKSIHPFPLPINTSKPFLFNEEEINDWYLLFEANYPIQNKLLFVQSTDREIVKATRRLVVLQESFDRASKEIKELQTFLENKKNQQGEK